MAVERYTVGKNRYNKRERISIGMGAEDAEALRNAFRAMVTAPATPEARIDGAVQWAKATLDEAGLPLDPNAWCYSDREWRRKNEHRSPEWYAITILHKANWLRRMIEQADPRMADFAFDLGALITEAYFILGAFVGTAARGGEAKAVNARVAVDGRIAECRRQAVDLWHCRRDWSAAEVARHIKNVPLAPSYIRKKIADLGPKKR